MRTEILYIEKLVIYLKVQDLKAGTLGSIHSPLLFNYENLNKLLKIYCLNLLVFKMGY